nr:histidine kinase N-terminal 7TM domain-containing protein [Ardenticatena sp.]
MNIAGLASFILLVMATLVAVVVWRVWNRFRKSIPHAFLGFGIGTVWWCITYALEMLAPSIEIKLLAAKAQYLAITLVPLAWAVFAYEYTRHGQRLPKWVRLSFLVIPTLTLVFVLGYPSIPLVWRAHFLSEESVVPVLRFTYGGWFWVHVGFAYFCNLFGAFYLVRFMLRQGDLYRGQALTLLLAVAFPWAGNLIYVTGTNPFPGLDLTPYAFGGSALAVIWGLFRYQLFEVVPVAREAVIRSSPTGIVVLDVEGRLIEINAAGRQLTGLGDAQCLGLFARDVLPGMQDILESAVQAEVCLEWQTIVDGEQRYINVRSSFLREPSGRHIGYVLALHDTTEIHRTAVELAAARDAAQAANRAKSTFLANMSHELRTPLTVIIGYTEMLIEDILAGHYDALDPSLERIHAAGQHLLGVVGELLDMSKIEAGKMEVACEWFDADELVESVLLSVQPLMSQQGNTFQWHLERIGQMYSDRTKVRQILYNLLSNAAKFTQNGEVTFRTEVGIDDRGVEWVVFYVSDTGVGILPSKIEAIFRPFEQAEMSSIRGTGLGLPITHRFCELLGGTIRMTSEPGQGTDIEVQLPRIAFSIQSVHTEQEQTM